MKAIVVAQTGGPDVLRAAELPDPSPGEGEVRVRVAAAGVNFIDVYERTGAYPVAVPFTPGREAAGLVDDVGPGVTDFAPGDPVAWATARGAYAGSAIVPADQLVAVPEGVELDTAAALLLQGLTAHYLSHDTFPVGPGQVALVHAAAGGVGLLLVQLAKQRGATVIGTVSTEDKATLARSAGADHVVRYTETDFVEATREYTRRQGVHVVYDSVGRTTFRGSLDCLRPRGMLVLYGQSSGPVEPVDPQVLNRKGSLFLTRPTLRDHVASRTELLSRAENLFHLVLAGALDVRIDHRFPLSRAGDAHRCLEERRSKGKVLLVP